MAKKAGSGLTCRKIVEGTRQSMMEYALSNRCQRQSLVRALSESCQSLVRVLSEPCRLILLVVPSFDFQYPHYGQALPAAWLGLDLPSIPPFSVLAACGNCCKLKSHLQTRQKTIERVRSCQLCSD